MHAMTTLVMVRFLGKLMTQSTPPNLLFLLKQALETHFSSRVSGFKADKCLSFTV